VQFDRKTECNPKHSRTQPPVYDRNRPRYHDVLEDTVGRGQTWENGSKNDLENFSQAPTTCTTRTLTGSKIFCFHGKNSAPVHLIRKTELSRNPLSPLSGDMYSKSAIAPKSRFSVVDFRPTLVLGKKTRIETIGTLKFISPRGYNGCAESGLPIAYASTAH